MIARNHRLLIWQYIKWKEVIKYIDSLKSRHYNASLQSISKKNNRRQKFSMEIAVSILLAIKQSLNDLNTGLQSFEIGYILFCFSSFIDIDISIFYYYRNNYNLRLGILIKNLALRIHYVLMIRSLQANILYLQHICRKSYVQFYDLSKIFYSKMNNQFSGYSYSLFVDLDNSFHYSFLLRSLGKMHAEKSVIDFFVRSLGLDYFRVLNFYFNIVNNNLFDYRNNLFKKLLEFSIVQIIYESLTLINYYYFSRDRMQRVIVLYDYKFLLFLCQDNYKLLALRTKIFQLFFSHSVIIKIDKIKKLQYLLEGCSTSLFLISVKYQVYPFYYTFKPSIYSQFIFMKEVSLILDRSKSGVIYLLNIRINMLILLWSKIYFKHSVDKVFHLLDYLIYLKIKAFSRNFSYSFLTKKKSSQSIAYSFRYKSCQLVLRKDYLKFFATIYNKEFYRFYFLIRLLEIYRIGCYINLREAI